MLPKCFILVSKAIVVVVVGTVRAYGMGLKWGHHSSRRYTVLNVETSF